MVGMEIFTRCQSTDLKSGNVMLMRVKDNDEYHAKIADLECRNVWLLECDCDNTGDISESSTSSPHRREDLSALLTTQMWVHRYMAPELIHADRTENGLQVTRTKSMSTHLVSALGDT